MLAEHPIKTLDVVCVWVGDKYSEDYVINLYNAVVRNTTHEIRFNVITDNSSIASKIPCRVIPIPDWSNIGIKMFDHRKAWWFKMCMFDPTNGFGDNTLYFDLDLVIINSIDKFFDHQQDKFSICQDFNRQYVSDYRVSNSSIMKFSPEQVTGIWKEWSNNIQGIITRFRGDQDFLTQYFDNNPDQKAWWPREWAMSWKWELEKGGKINNGTERSSYLQPDIPFILPEDCAVVVCHGDPKPHEIDEKIKKYWINK